MSISANAQWINIDKKALSFLASEEKINVIFAYNEILYNQDELTEATFASHIQRKITKHRNVQMANNWAIDFHKAKTTTWPEAFISTLNTSVGRYKNAPSFVLNDKTTKYTMVIHTYWMDFGYDAGAVKKPAQTKTRIYFYKTSDPINHIFSTKVNKPEGLFNESNYKNELWPRPSLRSVQDLYERMALNLAKSLKKIIK